jgi:hypothetical protein
MVHDSLIDALLADADEHEAAGRIIQACNARAAAENLRLLPPWNESTGPCPHCGKPYRVHRKWNGGDLALVLLPTCTCEEDLREKEVDDLMSRRFGSTT